MANPSATVEDFANGFAPKTGPSRYQIGAINDAIIRIVKQIYAHDTVKILSGWIGVSLKTAKNRILASREFSLDEVATLLTSEHGFRVLSAIMAEASKRPGYRAPDWWEICEPLMELADAERLCEAVRKRTDNVIRKREVIADALQTEIRRAQALAIHHPEQARQRLDALHAIARGQAGVVASKSGDLK